MDTLERDLSMKLFAQLTALIGVASMFAGAAFAQTPPLAPPMSTSKSAATSVKGYTKTLKNGKTVAVKGYTRKTTKMTPKMTTIKGYTKTLKNGKTVAVKGYTRKAPMGAKMK